MKKLEIFYEDIQPLKLQKTALKKHINNLIISELKEMGEISIVFCSDTYLLSINEQYLNHDYYTDIITFDYGDNDIISGDLFISLDRVIDNAKTFNVEKSKELFRVIFHGILHLIGYNDKSREEKKLMREKENQCLNEVEFNGMKL